jgi:hypothetical protein
MGKGEWSMSLNALCHRLHSPWSGVILSVISVLLSVISAVSLLLEELCAA